MRSTGSHHAGLTQSVMSKRRRTKRKCTTPAARHAQVLADERMLDALERKVDSKMAEHRELLWVMDDGSNGLAPSAKRNRWDCWELDYMLTHNTTSMKDADYEATRLTRYLPG
jgi:hypothetical protein